MNIDNIFITAFYTRFFCTFLHSALFFFTLIHSMQMQYKCWPADVILLTAITALNHFQHCYFIVVQFPHSHVSACSHLSHIKSNELQIWESNHCKWCVYNKIEELTNYTVREKSFTVALPRLCSRWCSVLSVVCSK